MLIRFVFSSFLLFFTPSIFAATYAQLSSLVSQMPSRGGASIFRLDKVDAAKNIHLSEGRDKVLIQENGLYFLMAAGQIGSTSRADTGYVDFWIIKNGKNVADSNTRMTVDPSNSTSVLVSQNVMELHQGDEISIGYSSSGPSLGFLFLQPDNEPAIPSMIFTILKIDTAGSP